LSSAFGGKTNWLGFRLSIVESSLCQQSTRFSTQNIQGYQSAPIRFSSNLNLLRRVSVDSYTWAFMLSKTSILITKLGSRHRNDLSTVDGYRFRIEGFRNPLVHAHTGSTRHERTVTDAREAL